MYKYIYACVCLIRLYLCMYIWGLYLNVHIFRHCFYKRACMSIHILFNYIVSHVHLEKEK